MTDSFQSRHYWEARYAAGGNSGAGSGGRLARFKAGFLNGFFTANAIDSVIDFGCGDGTQLALLDPRHYLGVDVSATALARCAVGFADRDNYRFAAFDTIEPAPCADLSLSLDVIYHLVEDAIFAGYMQRLFACARRFVIVYASNVAAEWPSPHVRHRCFTAHAARHCPEWRLLAHVPNPHAFDPARPDDTSFSDFYVFGRGDAPCMLTIPA